MSLYTPLHHMINDTNTRNLDSFFSLALSFQYPDHLHDFNVSTILFTRYTCTKRRLEACLLSLRHLLRLTAHLHLWLGCVAIRQLLAATVSSYSHDMTSAVRTHLVLQKPWLKIIFSPAKVWKKWTHANDANVRSCQLWESRPG